MQSKQSWQPLASFRDASVPKLDNLRRAAAAGLRVPPTWWLPAAALAAERPPPAALDAAAFILRSGSPTEDGRTTSNAGQLVSLIVERRDDYADSLRRVVAALPVGPAGRLGAVFVQPVVRGAEAGVAFFDGFYFERTAQAGLNTELTGGLARGAVTRGTCERDDAWSEWLRRVYAVFGGKKGDANLDVEFARDERGYVLLQVRPALFPVRRNPLLTQANLKETLGEWPSPWAVSGMVEAGHDLSFLADVEPELRGWGEQFAFEVGERAWANVSLWLRWADSLGVPRTVVTRSLGGIEERPADRQLSWRKLPRTAWRIFVGQWRGVRKIIAARQALERLDQSIDAANGLVRLYEVSVEAWVTGLHTAMAIAGVWATVAGMRKSLRLPGRARVVTQEMMEAYQRLAAVPSAERAAALDRWLAEYGHRGPSESDVSQPRFAELRDVLLGDLANLPPPPAPARRSLPRRAVEWLFSPLWWLDGRREWFRDECMKRWQRLRRRLLEEGTRLTAAGQLDGPSDVFWLRGQDLTAGRPLREAVETAKRRQAAARRVRLPITASLDTLTRLLRDVEVPPDVGGAAGVIAGIGLTPAVFEGRVRKADSLIQALSAGGLEPDVVLVVPALEPSWAVLFGRVGGVIAEVGGELSHASILLREARKPAVVNVPGVFARLRDGDRVRLDGGRGVVEVIGS